MRIFDFCSIFEYNYKKTDFSVGLDVFKSVIVHRLGCF